MNKTALVCIFFITLFSVTDSFGQSADNFYEKDGNIYYKSNLVTNIAYQKNADIIRLRHLKYYGNLIEEYFKKAGHYPFQMDSEVPTYVYIANSDQMRFTESYEDAIPFRHNTIPFKNFIKEVETVLGHEIEELYDPQEYPDVKWNWYLYSVEKDVFYFAIHVHQRFAFSKFIAQYFYKIEISNISNQSANLIIKTNELLSSELFIEEESKPIINEGYFTDREIFYLHDTKKQ